MKQHLRQWFGLACLLSLGSLVGCSSSAGFDPGVASASAPAMGGGVQKQQAVAGRMLVWTAQMGIEVEDLNVAAAQLDSQMADLGGYVEERGDYGSQRRRFVFRVPSAAFETALNTLEQAGEVRSREVKGVDVTEQYVDLETRLANNRALRDRLRELLAKAREVKDILLIETELNRLQSEIDSMEARLRLLGDQVQLATLTVDLYQKQAAKPRTIYGPLGYLYKGTEWFVTKLFVIRE